MKSDMEAFMAAFHPGFEGMAGEFENYMWGLFPGPRVFYHHDMCDVSPATVAQRKTRFFGHVNGYDPALVWHLKKFISEATKEGGKP